MSSKQLRIVLRGMHLVVGALIGLFIYAAPLRTDPTYAALIQLLVLPVLVLSGIAMWQQARINKWRNRRGRTPSEA